MHEVRPNVALQGATFNNTPKPVRIVDKNAPRQATASRQSDEYHG
jgi:hypothetical protein